LVRDLRLIFAAIFSLLHGLSQPLVIPQFEIFQVQDSIRIPRYAQVRKRILVAGDYVNHLLQVHSLAPACLLLRVGRPREIPTMSFQVSSLSIPAVLFLICFLSFPSQYLLQHLGPRPLEPSESILFNCSVALLLASYWRSIRTDPGRVSLEEDAEHPVAPLTTDGRLSATKQRWCRVCERAKPPRAHHCKVCKR
jgi:hypothetical protein